MTEHADAIRMSVERARDREVSDEDLPMLSSLIGAAPNLTGGLSTREYLDRVRGRSDPATLRSMAERWDGPERVVVGEWGICIDDALRLVADAMDEACQP